MAQVLLNPKDQKLTFGLQANSDAALNMGKRTSQFVKLLVKTPDVACGTSSWRPTGNAAKVKIHDCEDKMIEHYYECEPGLRR